MKLIPMFEENGCKLYGSGSFENAYFDTEKGNFRIIEVCVYYDLPLLMFVEGEGGEKYFASVCGEIFNRDNEDREWAYILAPIDEKMYEDLQNDKLEIDVPFLNAEKGYRIVVEDEEHQDIIFEVDPSDDDSFEHIPSHVLLYKD